MAQNNDLRAAPSFAEAAKVMAEVRKRIKHVIYIVKENRTYDQILGDLPVGNGDPDLVMFPRPITPNHHAMAENFVTLDNFLDSGESSNTGWDWTVAARTNDFTEREAPVNYAGRGLNYDQEGTNRNLNVGLATLAERRAFNPAHPNDPDLLAGTADVAGLDDDEEGENAGYIWNEALRGGLTVRNYGFFGDLSPCFLPPPVSVPLERDPAAKNLRVFFPDKEALQSISDPYFRGYDNAFPDYWRVQEWAREFDGYAKAGKLPQLTLLRLNHDHFGQFGASIDKVNTVETQMADNDYAIGLVAQKVANSRFAKDTLIFVIEDDAQDGPDHVDSHRSIAFVVGPYVKQRALVSTRHTTVSLVRTIVDVLGLKPLGLNDGLTAPMAEVFDLNQADWTYQAIVPSILRTTDLPLPPAAVRKASLDGGELAEGGLCRSGPFRDVAYWEAAMAGQDFTVEDRWTRRASTWPFGRAAWATCRRRPSATAATCATAAKPC